MPDETPCKCPPKAPEIAAGLESLPRQRQTFSGVRSSMLRAARLETPLQAWRADDADVGLLLAEGWAYVADVVGFYDAVIADETYLATAKRDRGLTRLLGLLGFRPRPGSGSTASISVNVSGASSVPVPLSGFRSEALGDEPPQVFENAATALAHPAANGWTIAPSRPSTFDPASNKLLFDPEEGVGLATGGLVLFRWTSGGQLRNDAARVLAVDMVRESSGRAVLEVAVDPMPPFTSSVALNDVDVLVPSNSASPTDRSPAPPTLSAIVYEDNDGDGGRFVEGFLLDAVYRALKIGQSVIVEEAGAAIEGARLSLVEEGGITSTIIVADGDPAADPPVPDVVAPVTGILFDEPSSFTTTFPSVYTIHYGMVRAGRLIRAASTALTSSSFTAAGILLDGVNELPPEPFRSGTFFLVGADGTAVRVEGEVVLDGVPGRLRFKLASGQTFSESLRTPVTIRGNVIDVTRGETVANELLGSGDSSTPLSSFKLARADLTYLPDAGTAGRLTSTLEVRVDGIRWTEVDSFFGRGPRDEVYIVRNDINDGRAVVTFGDGIRGRRPPTGTNNISATYRSGVGATRPPANTINSVAGAIKGVLSVTNPLPAEGGSDPEPAQTLRTSAPREALLLGRLVSVQDFQARVQMEPGVDAARAQWVWDEAEQRALVRIVYIGSPAKDNLESSIRLQAEPGVQFNLSAATPRPAKLGVEVLVDTRFVESDVQAAIEAALLDEDSGLLAPKTIGIGEPLYRSAVFERILGVPGVASVTSIMLFTAGNTLNMFAECPGAAPGEGAYFTFDDQSITVSLVESTAPVHACGA